MWWSKLDEQLSDSCKPCAEMAKDPAKTSWEFPERPWQHLHIEFAGPFLNYMWLILVYAHSKWPILIPKKDTSAENTVKMMLDTFTTRGLCEQIVSDNGSQFTSAKILQTKTNTTHSCSPSRTEKQRDLCKPLNHLLKSVF